MFTDEQFELLEEEEFEITEESILIMIALLAVTKTDLEKELRNFYQKYGKDGVVTYQEARKWVDEKDRRKRMTVLFLAVGAAFDSAFTKVSSQFEKSLREVLAKERDFFNTNFDIDDILSKKWGEDNRNWYVRLEDDVNLWKIRIANDIKQSLLCGESISDVLEQLDKRFKSIDNVITSLGISEASAYNSLARKEIFNLIGVTKYRFYTRPDERRCETCGAMHEQIFPMSAYEVGVTASPLHPRCRCWEVPILE